MPNLKRYTNNEKSCHGVKWPEGKGVFFSSSCVWCGVDSGLSIQSFVFGYLFCGGGEGVKAKSTQQHLTF
jgi:hypothetical protein